MSVVEGGPNAAGLIARVQNLLMKPREEWEVIKAEPATVQSLMFNYAAILAAIPAVAGFLSTFLWKHSLFGGLAGALLGYVLSLALVYVASIIINALAPSFGAVSDPIKALKAAVYASTAAWVAGAANIIPFLGGLIAFAGVVYTCYLLYLGLKSVLEAPQDRVLGFTIVSGIAYALLFGLVAWITLIVVGMFAITAAIGAAAVH